MFQMPIGTSASTGGSFSFGEENGDGGISGAYGDWASLLPLDVVSAVEACTCAGQKRESKLRLVECVVFAVAVASVVYVAARPALFS